MSGSRVLGCKCRVWGGDVVFSVWDVRLDILSVSMPQISVRATSRPRDLSK